MKNLATVVISVGLSSFSGISVAQTLNVGQSTVPSINGPMPTIQLPDQTNSLIPQTAQPTTQPQSSSDSANEPSARPDTPVTRTITRSGLGVSDTSKQQTDKASATEAKAPEASPTPQDKKTYVHGMILKGVARVYDGHSLTVGDDPVRLNGIDAPGLAQICSSHGSATWRCGVESRNFLANLIDRRMVTCFVEEPAGNGAAATCSSGQIPDVAKLVLQSGMAVVNSHGRKYMGDQQQAMRSHSGLWSGSFTPPAQWRISNP